MIRTLWKTLEYILQTMRESPRFKSKFLKLIFKESVRACVRTWS